MKRQQWKSFFWFLGLVFLSLSTLITLSREVPNLDLEQIGRAVVEEITNAPTSTYTATPTQTPTPVMTASKAADRAVITKIIDGDTVELESGEKVRYIGIDTPELHHPQKGVECFGKEASDANTSLVLGKTVRLQKDVSETDRYGRLLRYVWLEDTLINETLVAEGYARAVSYPPDTLYQQKFVAVQLNAMNKKLGAWTACPTFGK